MFVESSACAAENRTLLPPSLLLASRQARRKKCSSNSFQLALQRTPAWSPRILTWVKNWIFSRYGSIKVSRHGCLLLKFNGTAQNPLNLHKEIAEITVETFVCEYFAIWTVPWLCDRKSNSFNRFYTRKEFMFQKANVRTRINEKEKWNEKSLKRPVNCSRSPSMLP